MITDEMIEKAEDAFADIAGEYVYLPGLRAALEAAYPLIAAQVLDKAAETAYAWSWCEAVAENIRALKAKYEVSK